MPDERQMKMQNGQPLARNIILVAHNNPLFIQIYITLNHRYKFICWIPAYAGMTL
jgi:hypothetical protein